MLSYYQKMRLRHFFVARHRKGHGIHSPFLYDFLRAYYLSSGRDKLLTLLKARGFDFVMTESAQELAAATAEVVLWKKPFQNKSELEQWEHWRESNTALSLWLGAYVLVFKNPKLPNQHFVVRS